MLTAQRQQRRFPHFRRLALPLLAALPLLGGCCWLFGSKGPVSDELLTCRQLSIKGASALERGDLENGRQLLAQAVETCPVDPDARRNYAEVLWRQGEREKALSQLDEAIRLSAGSLETVTCELFVRRGEMLLALGRAESALASAAQALDLDPKFTPAWRLRARLMRFSGAGAQALADYHRALQLDPKDQESLMELAELHWRLADRDPAGKNDHCQRSLALLQELGHTYPQGQEPQRVLFLTGLVQLELNRSDEAATALAAACRAGSADAEMLYHLARAELLAGRSDAAWQAVQHALNIAPAHPASLALRDEVQTALAMRPPTSLR
ncbi:MAG: tetratricopeptide repeat protein [Planctomycetia bacterium]|nr:tetratricopeptide repeat protein [Planctomycetia bacterium]